MKKFVFRLAAALKARNVTLDAAKTRLADATARHTLALDLLGQRKAHLVEVATSARSKTIRDAGRELLRQRYQHQLREEIQTREHQLNLLIEEVEASRLAVAQAYRDVRALEVLEERDRAVWLEEMRIAEQKENDDHNSQRFGRS